VKEKSPENSISIQPLNESDEHFRTDHLKENLGGRTARSGVISITSQGFRFFASTLTTIILARLLTPEDYGLVGMVAIVTGFVSMYKDLGLSSATIQKEELGTHEVSTLFWVNVGVSALLAVFTVAIAPLVSWFYREPRLTRITIVYAIPLLLGGLAVQHEALLRRQMRFGALAVAEISALTAGLVVAIVFAWRGAGYWALVANQIVFALLYTSGVWIACRWRPGRPHHLSKIRSLLTFGSNITGFTTINYFARNVDNLLIGRVWGSEPLGLYARAYQLLILPIDQVNVPLTSVAVPALSRLTDSPDRYRRAYERLLEKIVMLTMPLMALMISTSDWMVLLLLGPKWIGVSHIFVFLGIAGFIQPVCNTTGWIFISQNRTNELLTWGLIGPTILVVSIVAGLPWGPVGVAAAYAATSFLVVSPLLFWFVGRRGPVKALDFYRVIAPAAFASVVVLLTLLGLRNLLTVFPLVLRLALSTVIAAVTALIVLAMLPAGRRGLNDLKRLRALLVEEQETSRAF
jgi:O-antigen/teichoic acid export membrane protein